MTAPKYKHPDSEQTWTGKGQQPAWIAAALAANPDATLESFEVGHKNYGAFIAKPTKENVTPLDAFDNGSVKKALANTKANGGKEGTFYQVPYANIRVDTDFNIRDVSTDYLRHRKWLGDQIVEHGYDRTKPMTGYVIKDVDGVDCFFLTDGFTRYGAIGDKIKEGKLPSDFIVPVMTPNEGTSREDMTAALFTANTGRQLTPNELAKIFKRLLGYGWDTKKVADRFDFTEPYVKDMLTLLTMPAGTRAAVEKGEVSATEAVKLTKKLGGKKAEKVVTEAVQKAKAAGKSKATGKHIKAAAGVEKPTNEQQSLPLDTTGSGSEPNANEFAALAQARKDIEAEREKAKDAIVQGVSAALIVPMQLLKDMVVYINDVKMPDDADAVALLARYDELLAANEAPVSVSEGATAAAPTVFVDVGHEDDDEI